MPPFEAVQRARQESALREEARIRAAAQQGEVQKRVRTLEEQGAALEREAPALQAAKRACLQLEGLRLVYEQLAAAQDAFFSADRMPLEMCIRDRYKGTPKLDLERLSAIRAAVSVPRVLHGASGVPDEAVRAAIARGIAKVNIATELKIPMAGAVREVLLGDENETDPRRYMGHAREVVSAVAENKILPVSYTHLLPWACRAADPALLSPLIPSTITPTAAMEKRWIRPILSGWAGSSTRRTNWAWW